MIPLSSPEIEHLASEVAKKAIRELLLTLGMDVSTPAEIKEVQKDIAHLRTLRLFGMGVANKIAFGGATAIGAAAIGYFFAHWHS